MDAKERFLRYVTYYTTSDDSTGTSPSTERQKDLGRLLMKELDELLRMVQFYTEGKPVADKLATIKWKGKREQFMSENENALRLYHMAERKLTPHFKDGKLPITAWRKERDRLEQE